MDTDNPFFRRGRFTGIDVHGAHGAVDFGKVKAAGHSWAFLKSSEGHTFTDARFSANRHAAHVAGLAIGAYHFARPSLNSAHAEAEHFLRTIGHDDTLLCALDIEEQGAPAHASEWAWEWLQAVEYLTGRVPMLYTYPAWWSAHGAPAPKFAAYPLWLAAYRRDGTPPRVPPWGRSTVWQFTSTAHVPGVSGFCDVSSFDGSPAELLALWMGKR